MMKDVLSAPEVSAAQVAAAFYEAFLGGDLAAAAEFLHPAVVLHVPGTHPLAGEFRGLDEVLGFVLASQEIIGPGTETIELLDVLGGTHHAAAYCRVTANRPDHRPLDNLTVHLLRIGDGRVVELWFHDYDGVSVDAFWN
jgi:ketosteroid isomerase-like protein